MNLIYVTPLILAAVLHLVGAGRGAMIALLIFTSLLIGFGVNAGADYFAYVDIQSSAPSLFNDMFSERFVRYYQDNGIEFGFAFLNVLLKSFGFNGQSIFILMSIISTFFIYKTCRIFGLRAVFIVFIAIYVLAFSGLWNQIRYGLAILIVFYACLMFVEKRYVFVLFLILFSVSFHSISLLVFFVLAIYWALRKVNASIALLASGIVIISIAFLFLDLKSMVMFGMQYFNPRYSAYEEAGGTYTNFLIRLLFCTGSFFLLSKSNIKNDRRLFMLFILVGCSLIVWSLAWRIDVLYRVGVMFEFGYILLLSRSAYPNRYQFIIGCTLFMMLLIWRLIQAIDVLNDYNFYFFLTSIDDLRHL